MTPITFAWMLLIAAGVLEVAMTTCLKLCNGFTNPPWGWLFLASALGSFVLLSKASQTIPLGMSYAVWTGIGAVGTVLVQIIFFREPAGAIKLGLLAAIIGCIIGLKWTER